METAQAFSLLWDGYPEDIGTLARIEANYFGLDFYGLDEIIAFDEDTDPKFHLFLNAANQHCTPS